MNAASLLGLCLLAAPVCGQGLQREAPSSPAAAGGAPVRVGTLSVPQFHERPDAGSIELAFTVLETSTPDPGPAIYVLVGLPSSATAMSGSDLWTPYLASADVVLVDQRGSGRSQPRLMWDEESFRAERLFGNPAAATAHAVETAGAIRRFAEARGIHLDAFNTRESARDIEAVRASLGHDRIDLVAHSGGTHLALEYLRRFPARVAHFASLGTAGPGDIHALPSRLDRSLQRVSELVAADPRIGASMPDFFGRVEALGLRLGGRPLVIPVEHPESGEAVALELGRHGFQLILLFDLGDPSDLVVFPRMVHEIERGETSTLSWFVTKRYRQMCSWPAVAFLHRASSGATASRWARIRDEAETSPFGMARCFFSPDVDAAFGVEDLGDAFREPVRSDVPTLFVSGDLDANTPPEQAEEARRGFPRSRHLVIRNGGHDALMDLPAVHETIRAFFAGQPVDDVRIELPAPRFALLEGPDPEVDHPALR